MSYNANEAYQHALCMELQNDKFSYSIIDKNLKKSVKEDSFTLSDFNKDTLAKIVDDQIFKNDFKSASIVASTNRHTLVPSTLFNESEPKEIFNLNHQPPFDDIDYNRISELGIVSIYEMPLWIKQLFVTKIPKIKTFHTSTVFLKGIFKAPQFSPRIHILIQNESFYLAITSKNRLDYFNLFQSNKIEDIVYHLLFVLEQKELNIKEFEINVLGVSNKWLKLEAINDLLKQKVKVHFQPEKSEQFILFSQLLCV
jgi:hypothetical protein